MKRRVRERLWNDADGIYENRFWSGEFSKRLSPSSFYPMLAGIATPQQAERMVREHLLNPREFWGEYVAPTTSRSDPAFADQYYWRGSLEASNFRHPEAAHNPRIGQFGMKFIF
jgi:glycogen debranching enzyme